MEIQALWFEQLYQPLLTTDDGRTVEIIQPGFWNHGHGPDFTRAVVDALVGGQALSRKFVLTGRARSINTKVEAENWPVGADDRPPIALQLRFASAR